MKKLLLVNLTLVLALIAVLGLSIAPAAAQQAAPSTITVTGYGEAFGAPDVAYIEVGVDISDKDINAAFSRANGAMNAVIVALTGLGIAPEDLRTTNISVYSDNYNPQTGQTEETPFYRVSNSLQITVRSIAQVPDVISSAVSNGANRVSSLSFGIANTTVLEGTARSNAVEDAKARAQNLAELTGLTLGAPVKVVEYSGGALPFYNGRDAAAQGLGGGGVPVQTGQLSVSMQVEITFAVS